MKQREIFMIEEKFKKNRKNRKKKFIEITKVGRIFLSIVELNTKMQKNMIAKLLLTLLIF
jgi:hypothetical protein